MCGDFLYVRQKAALKSSHCIVCVFVLWSLRIVASILASVRSRTAKVHSAGFLGPIVTRVILSIISNSFCCWMSDSFYYTNSFELFQRFFEQLRVYPSLEYPFTLLFEDNSVAECLVCS
jgi:hypothetical protein